MSEYIFILGRESALSVAEIAAVARRQGVALKWLEITLSYARVQAELPPGFFGQLAGTIKLAQVAGRVQPTAESLEQLMIETLESTGNEQWHFGLSWYGGKPPRWLKEAGMSVKHQAREAGRRARLVVARDPQLSSVVVAKNKLLPPQGCEFILLPQAQEVLVGRTLAVQEFEDWSQRDYGRPERDLKVGMLPPKLARLMINLAAVPTSAGLLDPFCGSGTVLQEAALLGYQELWGADADDKGIERSRANFKWLKERYVKVTIEPHFIVSSIADLPRRLTGRRFNAIVTEPYLGPALTGREDPSRLSRIQQELTGFYRRILATLAELLEPGGSLVMIWPVIYDKSGFEQPLLVTTAALEAGFELVDPLPPEVPVTFRRQRGTLLYHRPNQHLGREILVLHKN